jgi:DNA-binding CsgD family transcriptional regulator
VPANLRATIRDLALAYAAEIVAAATSASLWELFEPEADREALGERVSRAAAQWGAKYKLSAAEVDVLGRAALGETRAEIARRRGTSVQTVETQAARLLRRTRDESLEGAANRLLRDLIKRSPPAVATAAPGRAAETGGGPLQARIEQLRLLAARPPEDSVRYAMGAIVKELKSHPEMYGDSAVSAAAVAIGEDLPGLYRFASVAERWSAREVNTLLSGRAVSWSHLVALARVDSPAVRERFARRVQREGLSLRQLVAALEAAGLR